MILTEMAILAIVAASLHFFMSHGGITSFGHAAFFGLGAYGAALAVKFGAMPFAANLLPGPLVAGLAALACGWFVLRAQGVYAAMLTLAFAQILWSVATQWVAVSGGDNGILGLWPPAIVSAKAAYYGLTLLLAVASLWLARRTALAPLAALRCALRVTRRHQSYVIGVNTIGVNPIDAYGGTSLAADPLGAVIARAGPDEELITAAIDPDTVSHIREAFPVGRDRKPDGYDRMRAGIGGA